MIQIIHRVARIFDVLSRDRNCKLGELARLTGLKKSTLGSILQSLLSVEYVEKVGEGTYAIGPGLLAVAYPRLTTNTLLGVAEKHARDLAADINERVVIAVLLNMELRYITEAAPQQSVVVSAEVWAKDSVYGTASGRVLLAHLDDSDFKVWLDLKGLPDDDWTEITSARALRIALKEIRTRKMALKRTPDGQAQSLAVPVFGPDGSACAAIGVVLPARRFVGRHRKMVIETIEKAGRRMTESITLRMAEQ